MHLGCVCKVVCTLDVWVCACVSEAVCARALFTHTPPPQVVEVASGDTLVVSVASGEERRVSLASIRAPRAGNPRAGVPAQPYAYEVSYPYPHQSPSRQCTTLR